MNYGPSNGPVSLTEPSPIIFLSSTRKNVWAEFCRVEQGTTNPADSYPTPCHSVIHHSKIYIFQSTYHTHTAPTSLVIIKRLDIINNLLLLSRAALTQLGSLNSTWFSLLNWWMNVIIKMLELDALLSHHSTLLPHTHLHKYEQCMRFLEKYLLIVRKILLWVRMYFHLSDVLDTNDPI